MLELSHHQLPQLVGMWVYKWNWLVWVSSATSVLGWDGMISCICLGYAKMGCISRYFGWNQNIGYIFGRNRLFCQNFWVIWFHLSLISPYWSLMIWEGLCWLCFWVIFSVVGEFSFLMPLVSFLSKFWLKFLVGAKICGIKIYRLEFGFHLSEAKFWL